MNYPVVFLANHSAAAGYADDGLDAAAAGSSQQPENQQGLAANTDEDAAGEARFLAGGHKLTQRQRRMLAADTADPDVPAPRDPPKFARVLTPEQQLKRVRASLVCPVVARVLTRACRRRR